MASFPCLCANVLWYSAVEAYKAVSECRGCNGLARTQVAKRLAERWDGLAWHCLLFRNESLVLAV